MASVNDTWHKTVKRPDDTRETVRSSRYGRGKRYRVTWYDDAGNSQSEAFTKKSDAERYKTKIESELQRGEYVDPDAGKKRFRVFAYDWLASQPFEGATQEIRETQLEHLCKHLGDRELKALRPSTVQATIATLHKTLAASYVRDILSVLSTILQAAVDDGLIARNPCKAGSIKTPAVEKRKVQPWSTEQVAAMLASLDARYADTATLAVGVGLRQGEVLGLAVDDVDWLRGVVHVRRQVKLVKHEGKRALVFALPKGGKTRDVPLPEWVSLRLAATVKAYPPMSVSLPWRVPGGAEATAQLLFTRNDAAVNKNTFNGVTWRPAL